MFVVDTNLLIYAANEEAAEFPRAKGLLDEWRNGTQPWFLTWSIVYEFLSVMTHRRLQQRAVPVGDAWRFIQAVLATPSLSLLHETPQHSGTLRGLIAEYPLVSGNILHDVHIVTLMTEHGVDEIRTADRHFHRFPFLRVVNPLV